MSDEPVDDRTTVAAAESLDSNPAEANERTSDVTDGARSGAGMPRDGAAVLDERVAEDLVLVERLSTLLDESIDLPGGYRIGVDPIVGILPVVGDLFASAVSVYIVLEAASLGVPRTTLARMVLNVAVDTVFGSVPIVGPVFDAVYKANTRNATLLERRLEEPTTASVDRRTLLVLGVVFVALAVALAAAAGATTWWLLGEMGLL